MQSSRFDDLTKALATSTSRRQALQRIGGTLAGSVLAAWPFTRALAAGGGNSQCAKFCASVFGADTPGAKQCTSDAAHGKGLCYTCGPASPNGTCTSYTRATCCSGGQGCQNGTCVTPCVVLSNGTRAQPCDVNNPSACSSCYGGFCERHISDNAYYCAAATSALGCDNDSNGPIGGGGCPSGFFCSGDLRLCIEACTC